MALALQFGLALTLRGADGLAGEAPAIPFNTAAPVVTGTAQDGQTLNTTNGVWDNAPTGFAYQWKRAGAAILGETAAAYTCAAADVGSTLTCTVTATNGAGSRSATSAPTAAVIAAGGGAGGAIDFTDPEGLTRGIGLGIL